MTNTTKMFLNPEWTLDAEQELKKDIWSQDERKNLMRLQKAQSKMLGMGETIFNASRKFVQEKAIGYGYGNKSNRESWLSSKKEDNSTKQAMNFRNSIISGEADFAEELIKNNVGMPVNMFIIAIGSALILGILLSAFEVL